MQRTKSKILSILLSLVMLLSLLPTTALAAGNYPDYVRVFNASGDTTSLSDKQYLAANSDTAVQDGYDGTQTYVARYDKSSGTLYLNGYHGAATHDMIFALGDLNIEVENDSSFTTSTTATGNLYGIRADSGKLNISGTGKLTVTAKGSGNVYGISAKEGVTISAPLAVTVGKNSTTENGSVYGIHAQSGTISLPGNDMTVTATGGAENAYGVYNEAQTSSSAAGNGNIDISGKLTVDLSGGSNYNRGISSQGGDITLNGATVKILGSYRYGIFNINGNVVIKSTPDVELTSTTTTSSGEGICTYDGGDLTIENSTVKVSVDTLAANLKGNVSIKDSTVELTSKYNHYEVIRTGNSSAVNTINLSTKGSVTLTASGEQTNAMISGKVTLGPNTKCEKGKIDNDSYDGEYDGSSKTVLKFVHEAPASTADISLSQTSTMDFGSAEENYAALAAKPVTITNNGTANTGELTIALDGANKTNFMLNKTSITDIAAGATDTFTVQPKPGLTAGIYNATVKVSGTGVTEQKFDVKFTVTTAATSIAVPTANSVTYNGTKQTGVSGGTGYTLGGDYEATDVGATDYTATATLNPGYKWDDDSIGDKTITWNIGKRTPTVADFVFALPTDLTYDGNNKTAGVTLKSPLTKSGAITVKYEKGGASVTEAKDVGDYTVKIDVADGDNFTAGSNLTDLTTWTFSITRADQNAPTGLGVAAPTTSSGKGKITGTTDKMEYSTDNSFTSPAGTTCTDTATEVAPGTYYVRFKADSNHNAGTVSAALLVPAYSATPYSITVTNDGNGNASADKTSAVAGETVTLTATPSTGYVFDKWVDKTPTSLTIVAGGTFTMPSGNVSVKATFKPADLTGMVNITGTLKFNEELTASLASTNNTGTLTYKWYRGSDEIIGATGSTYTLVEDDIGKTITVKITSDVQKGEITGSTTGTIDKADGPTAPSAFTLTFTLNSDGTTFTATIPTVAGGEYSFDGTNYSATNTKADCTANTSYTGHVRIAATSTHEASTATSSTQTSPKLTVATPTFTPNGASSFTGPQSVTISCTTAGATIHYTTDGTDPTASSPVYSTELSLTSTTTVKAIAVMTDMNDSAIATATFTKYSGGGGGGGGSSSGGGGGSSATTPSVSDKAAKELKNAKEGSTVTIDMKGETKLPASVTKEIAGKDVTVELDMGGGMVWSFNGLDVPKGGVRLDLGVKTGTKTIPAKVINALTGETTTIQLQLNHNGPFGMLLNLSVDLGKKHNGMYANLYFYNSKSGELEFQSAGMISDGKASWAFDHASDYAIVIDKESHEPMTFTDVPASAYYAEAVNWAVAKKITGGIGNGLFGPNDPCTRAQIVTFLWRAAGSPAPKNTGTAFGDVKPGSFYEQAVAWAVENGITGGTGDGKFSPDATCTRAQSVTFLYRAVGSPAVSGNAEFGDVATNAYYADAVAWAAKNGITGGIGGGLFGSGNDCTRGQIVTFLHRAYNK